MKQRHMNTDFGVLKLSADQDKAATASRTKVKYSINSLILLQI